MILDFGYVCMEMRTVLATNLHPGQNHSCVQEHARAGGPAGTQALAAARYGAKVTLCASIGDDLYGQLVLQALRRDGIQPTALATTRSPTGLLQHIISADGETTTLLSAGANLESTADQVSETALNERTLLLIQNHIEWDITAQLIKRAKAKGARTMLAVSDDGETTLPSSELEGIDYIISQSSHAHLPPTSYIPMRQDKTLNDLEFHVFCGVYAACVQANLSHDVALTHTQGAVIFASETNAVPYLDDIKTPE